jgi:RHS repeat-associated protein
MATYDNDGLHYYLNDPLGTRRAQTDSSGALEQTCASLPYGDGLACTNSTLSPTENHFTGKERDTESGNDYFDARYYSSSMGRFMSPDWSAKEEPVPYAKLDDPQSLNLYSYVLNNPLIRFDDDGHEIIYMTTGPGALQNEQTVRDSVTALLANPNTNGYLQQFVGTAPGTPDIVIMNGDLSAGDSKTTAPDGTPGTSTVQGNTDPNITTDGKSGGPIITIDNRTTAGETPGVLTHEVVHAGESQKDPAKFAKDSKAEAALPHDKRPQEQRAIAVQKAQGPAITKEVKRIEKERKKEQSQ